MEAGWLETGGEIRIEEKECHLLGFLWDQEESINGRVGLEVQRMVGVTDDLSSWGKDRIKVR